jgi:hypothetical protein
VLLQGLQRNIFIQGNAEVPAIKSGIDKASGLVDDILAVV